MGTLERQSVPKFDGEDDDYAEFVMNMQLFCAGHKKDERCLGPRVVVGMDRGRILRRF